MNAVNKVIALTIAPCYPYFMITINIKQDTTLKSALERGLPLGSGRIRQLVADGNIRINGRRIHEFQDIHCGDTLKIFVPKAFLPVIPILYADASVLIVEKPTGIAVLSDEGLDLAQLVQNSYPTARPCHRLDVWTGGLMLFALSDEAESAAFALIYHHQLVKRYHCLITGEPPCNGRHRAYLVKNAQTAKVSIQAHSTPGALPVETETRLLKRSGDVCELEVVLHTGRTHQIRAHLAYLGCPILGDDKYGSRMANRKKKVRHPCLWACALDFPKELPPVLQGLAGSHFESAPRFPIL